MRRLLLVGALALLTLPACSILDPVKTGTTTTDFYNEEGEKTQTVTTTHAIGDKVTEYNESVRQAIIAAREVAEKKIDAIMEKTAVYEGEPADTGAWKQAAGLLAIDKVDNDADKAIQAIYYGKDKYDVSIKGLDVGGDVVKKGVDGFIVDRLIDGAGTRTTQIVEGENNKVTFGKGSPVDDSYEYKEEKHETTTTNN
ncbi:hypothetical protein [Desulfogranum japonicum]|uniref:hypothetical protein n=1 Tax=Desulfogranum japonicum TaxID=231447 RepID=UPI000401E67A|nr:hypothetical protein [Desulfogranum japonicum]